MNPEGKMSTREHQHAARPARFGLRHLAAALLAGFALAAAAEPAAIQPAFHATLRAASDAAAADQSLVLLVFGADWCGPCQALKKKTLSASEFLSQGGALHIAEVDVDADQRRAHDFAIEAVPTSAHQL